MPELIEQMYSSRQIIIPPKFPYILKRYCKAAIKTQPYDLLRWSFEYFKALAENREPPVKLRLEYPVYTTEGGLTRGCLKVLANQLAGMSEVPLPHLKNAWRGFCLDPTELKRVLCLCEVYLRKESVPLLHFLAVAGGMLTKSLTNTMILLCETLTKEPDGGSAAIPVDDFLIMYNLLAKMDASKDVIYIDGYREGEAPELTESETKVEEEETTETRDEVDSSISDDYWQDTGNLQKLALINDHVTSSARLSLKLNMPIFGNIERSPSVERAGQIERDNYLRERKGRAVPSDEVEQKLKELSAAKLQSQEIQDHESSRNKEEEVFEKKKEGVDVFVYDEDGNMIPFKIYGEPMTEEEPIDEAANNDSMVIIDTVKHEENVVEMTIAEYVAEAQRRREERLQDLIETFDDIAAIVNRFKSANYDLGMVAGRQMSTTSGEFIAQHIEKEIMSQIDEQIVVLPDPDLKKKKAKPEEVTMIRDIVETFLNENMDIIVPDAEEIEEEEQPIPEIIVAYAVPGIGGPVDVEIIKDFVDYALEISKIQADMFMPRNIRHFLCPPLEKYEECKYEKKKEEVPTGGVITD